MKLHQSLGASWDVGVDEGSLLLWSLWCGYAIMINIFNHIIYFNYCLSIIRFYCHWKVFTFLFGFVCWFDILNVVWFVYQIYKFPRVSFVNIVNRNDWVVTDECILFLNYCFVNITVSNSLNTIWDELYCLVVGMLWSLVLKFSLVQERFQGMIRFRTHLW